MSNSQEQAQQIAVEIADAEKAISLLDAFERLQQMPDFNLVIGNGYFEQESIRLVLSKANPELQNEDMQKSIMKSIDAIGEFRQYLVVLTQRGHQMRRAIAEQKAEQEAIRNEEAD